MPGASGAVGGAVGTTHIDEHNAESRSLINAASGVHAAVAASSSLLLSSLGTLASTSVACPCFATRRAQDPLAGSLDAADAAASDDSLRKLWKDPMAPSKRRKPVRQSADESISLTFGHANSDRVRVACALPGKYTFHNTAACRVTTPCVLISSTISCQVCWSQGQSHEGRLLRSACVSVTRQCVVLNRAGDASAALGWRPGARYRPARTPPVHRVSRLSNQKVGRECRNRSHHDWQLQPPCCAARSASWRRAL